MQRAVPRGECLNSPHGLKRHSPTKKPKANNSIGTKSVTGGKEAESLLGLEETPHADLWAKLVGKTNEDQVVINEHPVTALLDMGAKLHLLSRTFTWLRVSKFIHLFS